MLFLSTIGCSNDADKSKLRKILLERGEENFQILSYTVKELETKSRHEGIIEWYEDTVQELEMHMKKAKRRGQIGAWKSYRETYRKYSKELDSVNDIINKNPITLDYEIIIFDDRKRELTRHVFIKK